MRYKKFCSKILKIVGSTAMGRTCPYFGKLVLSLDSGLILAVLAYCGLLHFVSHSLKWTAREVTNS